MSKLTYLPSKFTMMIMLITMFHASHADCELHWLGKKEVIEIYKDLVSESLLCDSATAVRSLNKAVNKLQGTGYLLATYNYDRDSSSVVVSCYLGIQYRLAEINPGNIPPILLSRSSTRGSDLSDQIFNLNKFSRLINELIRNSEDNGLPFASVYFDSLVVRDSTVYGRLRYDPGPTITFDSLLISKNAKIKRRWLESYLGIRHEDLFSQKALDDVPGNIAKLSFIELAAAPSVTFQNKQARVILNLEEKKVSTIDGIVGFLPNEEEDGKLLITGQVDLSLSNLFRSGKKLGIKWQSLKARSQFLDIVYVHPNLFHSAIDFQGQFNLLKEDTLFITRQMGLNFSYETIKNKLTVFSEFISSGLLGVGNLTNANVLPETLDLRTNYYGVAYQFSKLNQVLTPKKGLCLETEMAVGSKEVERNPEIPDQLYNDIDLTSVQYNLNGSFGAYLQLSKHLILHSKIEGGTVINNQLFLNDLYRIGGLNSLRGFNENFFFAQDYVNTTVELQFHFQDYSYLFAFYDQAYLYYDLDTSSFEDYPLGVGLGLNLYTGTGSINLAYALGKSNEQPLSLNLSKFHFGYVARF